MIEMPPDTLLASGSAGLMRIGEISVRTGISRETLNHYLLLGLIMEETQTRTGRRLFSPAVLEELAVIESMKPSRTLKEIREWLSKGRRVRTPARRHAPDSRQASEWGAGA